MHKKTKGFKWQIQKQEQVKNQKDQEGDYIQMKIQKILSELNLRRQRSRKTVAKVKKIKKPFARKIQILTVGEQRAKVMGKKQVAAIFKRGKDATENK